MLKKMISSSICFLAICTAFAGNNEHSGVVSNLLLSNANKQNELAHNVSLQCYSLGIRTNTQYECEYYVGHYTNYPLANWMPSTECRGCNP